MNDTNKLCGLLFAVLTVVMTNTKLFAQDELAEDESVRFAEAEEMDAVGLPTVIVTADKTETNKQELPAIVTVFDETQMELLNLENIEDIVHVTPNTTFYRSERHFSTPVFRGIGGTTNMNKVWNTHVDGVTLPYVGAANLLDVERIEVLRGSQGAIYGRNSHAGVLNILTKNPSIETEGALAIAYESYNTVKAEAMVSGPVNEQSGFRINAAYDRTDGYFDNSTLHKDDLNDDQHYTVRGKYFHEISENSDLTFSMIFDEYEGGFDSYSFTGSTTTTNNIPGYTDGYLYAPTLTFNLWLEDFEVTSISNYSRSNYGFLHDWDFSASDIYTGEYDEVYNTLSEEIRFSNSPGAEVQWLAGLFLLYENIDTQTDVVFSDDAALFGMSPGDFMVQDSTVETMAVGVFGQTVFMLGEHIEVTGRMRVDYEEKSLDWLGTSNMYADIEKSFDESWVGLSPSLAIAYLFDENKRVYLSASRGYKAGDYNNVQVDAAVVNEAVDPELTTTYEVGYKGLHWDNQLEINAGVFHTEWKDLQVEQQVGVGVFQKQNAAEAHSNGMEVEMRALPHRDWELIFGASWLFNHEFDEFPNSSSGNLAGKGLPNAIDYKLIGAVGYKSPNGFFTSVDTSLNGPRNFDETNTIEQGAHPLVNFKIGYNFNEDWSLFAYGRNVLDEQYIVSSALGGGKLAGEPSVFGFQLKRKF